MTARLGRALYTLAKGDDVGLITPGYILHDVVTVTPSGAYEVSPTPEGLFKLFVENLWIHACIATNSAATAAAPWNLKRWNTETGQGDVVSDHPLIDLLEQPYEGATYETLVQTIDAHLDIAGNAFIEIVKGSRDDESDDDAPAMELRPLLPTKMRVIVHPQNGVERYIYRPNMIDIDLDPKDVIHLKLVDPRSETKGVGPVLPAWLTARVDQEALRWNAGFFKRGATPGVVLETPEKIPQAERTRIIAEFDEKFGGTDKAHKTACLPYGLKATPFGQTMREMQFRELRKMTREEISAILKTPPILLGLLDQSSYSNAYLQLQIYRDFRVLGRLRYVHAMLTRALAPRYEDGEMLYIEPDVSEMRLPDEEDRELTRAVQLMAAGIIDRDEARAMIQMAPAEKGAGEPKTEASAPSVDEQKPESEPTAKRATLLLNGRAAILAGHVSRGSGRTWLSRLAKTAPHLLAGSADVQKRRRAIASGVDSARQPASGGTPTRRAEFQKEDGATDDEEGHAVPLTPWRMAKARDKSVTRNEPAVTKIMVAWLARVKAKALALVRSKVGKAETEVAAEFEKARGDESAPRVDITEEELREILAEPLTRALQDALRRGLEDGGQDAADGIGVAFGLPNEDVSTYLSDRETNLESVLNEDTAAMVKDVLRAGYEDGDSPVELIERIAESGAFTQARAQRIARTELHAAHGAGAFAQMKASGVEKKQWIASSDEATRESHREASGQIVGIDESFQVGDAELMYPGDPDGPAEEVINCFLPDTVIGGQVNLAMRSRYAGPVIKITTRSGSSLSVTPNHPVCTSRGVIPAKDICKGDNLIRYSDGTEEPGCSWFGENEYNIPSKIEDVFGAFCRGGRLCSKHLAARDLHGDAVNVDGQIDIVLPKCALRSDLKPPGRQFVDQFTFVAPNATTPSFSRNGGAKNLGSVPLASPRLVFDLQSESFGRASRINSSLHQYAPCSRYADADFLRYFLEGCPGLVPSDDLISLLRSDPDLGGGVCVSDNHAGLDKMSSDNRLVKPSGRGDGLEGLSAVIPIHDELNDVGLKNDLATRGTRRLASCLHGLQYVAQRNANLDESPSEDRVAESSGLRYAEERLARLAVSSHKGINIVNHDACGDDSLSEGPESIAFPDEALGQSSAGVTELWGKHYERFAGLISLDEVVEIHRLDYRGFVFDVQSPYGWIVANGLLCLQCRCVLITSRGEPSADDLDALTDPIEGDDDAAVEQARDAVRGLPDDVLSRVDARAMSGLMVDRGRGSDVEYDGEERTLTVGPKAKPRTIQDGVKEHLVNTVTTATDARGFHNARRLSGLPDVGGKEDGPGTERERAVALVSRAATGDREGLEALTGALTDDQWAQYKVLAANFWAGFGVKGGKPERRESDGTKTKAETR